MKLLCLLACLVLSGTTTVAQITVYIYESGSDVLVQGSGSINTSSLTTDGTVGVVPAINTNPVTFFLGPSGISQTDSYRVSLTGPATVGPGFVVTTPNAGTGDFFGLYRAGSADAFYLNTGYTSGSSLFATNTYLNKTIANLGLTVGDYTWTWGSGGDAGSWTVRVGTAPPIPEASHYALVASLAALAAGAWGKSRR